MKLRFTGQYTGGRTAITIAGVTFEGREPSEVPADSGLLSHPEFERVHNGPHGDEDAMSARRGATLAKINRRKRG